MGVDGLCCCCCCCCCSRAQVAAAALAAHGADARRLRTRRLARGGHAPSGRPLAATRVAHRPPAARQVRAGARPLLPRRPSAGSGRTDGTSAGRKVWTSAGMTFVLRCHWRMGDRREKSRSQSSRVTPSSHGTVARAKRWMRRSVSRSTRGARIMCHARGGLRTCGAPRSTSARRLLGRSRLLGRGSGRLGRVRRRAPPPPPHGRCRWQRHDRSGGCLLGQKGCSWPVGPVGPIAHSAAPLAAKQRQRWRHDRLAVRLGVDKLHGSPGHRVEGRERKKHHRLCKTGRRTAQPCQRRRQRHAATCRRP